MANIYTGMTAMIGNTPMLELDIPEARVLAKLEMCNPGGSVKDRAALSMLTDAKEKGLLHADSIIIEPTSGNTGIGLCAIAAAWGLQAIIVMPDSMSRERQLMMKAYGAQVVLTPGALGMAGAIEKAQTLAAQTPHAILTGQFSNPANPAAHEKTTGPEIWRDTEGKVDIFIAGVGTGGTVSGVGRYLKKQNPAIEILAVEPETSAILSGRKPGSHGIQGIGAGFVPEALDRTVIDGIMPVPDAAAMETARNFARKYGLLAGISSGAALWAAEQIAKRPENHGKTIVTLLPDSGERYLSTGLYD